MRYRNSALLIALAMASATFAVAQTPPAETPPNQSTDPASASSPHQRQVTEEQMMKDCMKKQHAKDASMSQEQLKATCKSQMQNPSKQ